ncbi:MAG TPA: phosphotransferase [Gaiellaceae bacterium]|nr:phosphotransferase [Gaiellaceae bacterium]
MAQIWRAEQVVGEELARALVREQFPSLRAGAVELVSSGWDYTVHRVDGDWAFRFPRREVVVAALRREVAVVPALAPLLPAPVSAAVHVGVPGERFPWPFYGARWLEGREATLCGERAALAPQLGRFLRRLHDAAVPGLPVDVNGRADMRRRVPVTREALAAIGELWTAPPAVERLLDRAFELPPPARLVTCHGDLHVRQLLVDGPRLTGVVDWVDVCLSDPGVDLMVVYAFLPPEARPAFFAEYGEAAADSLLRARVLALNLSAILARWAHAEDNRPVEEEALASLDRTLADF